MLGVRHVPGSHRLSGYEMKHIGLARLGKSAELKTTQGGEPYANLSLAVDYTVKKERLTQWVSATLWGKQAEALTPYLLKGTVHCFALRDMFVKDGTDGKAYLNATVESVELGPKGQGGQAAAPKTQAGGSQEDDPDVPF
jgi:single-strand DNA-binding protein